MTLTADVFSSATQEFKTVGDFFRFAITTLATEKVFLGHGTDDLQDEAWWLVAGALSLPLHMSPKLFLSARLTPTEKRHLVHLIYRRGVEKMPTAYLLKQAYQNGQPFYVDERVLIPRSPIAELIDHHFEPWLSHPESIERILDLCTGSGCLAILSALAFPDAKVDALELSEGALAVAERNIAEYGLQDQVRLLPSDVFSGLQNEQYDVVISNPPYVDAADLRSMPAEFHHEPRMALAAGEDGLEIVCKILKEARAYLKPEGLLIVEVGNSRAALEAAFPTLPFIWLDFERGGEGVFLLKREDLPA